MRESKRVDVLLTYPPWDVNFYQPAGLPQLAGYLLSEKIEVKILDTVTLKSNFKLAIEKV